MVIINTLKGLPRTKLDAAWGLTGLVALYAIRIACDILSKRFPRRARVFFFISVLRNAFVLLILTIAAWLYTRHRINAKGKYPISILEEVPSGLRHVKQPDIDPELVSALAGQLPVATIILLLEHIAISKCASFFCIRVRVTNSSQHSADSTGTRLTPTRSSLLLA